MWSSLSALYTALVKRGKANKGEGEKGDSSNGTQTMASPSPSPPRTGGLHRIAMFKIPATENQQRLLDAFKVLAKDQQRVRLCRRFAPLVDVDLGDICGR